MFRVKLNRSLKAQFTLLIIGIFLIPALAGLGMGVFNWFSSENSNSSFRMLFHVLQEVNSTDALDDFYLGEKENEFLSERNGQLVVTNSDSEVVVFQGGRFSSYEDLISQIRVDNAEIFRLQVNRRDGTYDLLIVLDPVEAAGNFQGTKLFPGLILITLFMTFLYILLSSLGIIRGINARIRELEKAMREISGGNLDYQVSGEGPDGFASLAESLDSMRKQLKDDEESRTRFMMSISHDLKTPLSTIDGYLDALMEGFGKDEATREKFYQTMKEKSEILKERVAGLIDFAKMSTGEWIEHLVPVRVEDFFKDFINSYRIEADLRDYKLTELMLPDLDLSIEMDEQLVYRAMENLVQNAMKYSDERREIVLGVERGEKELRFKVGNYGPGIQPGNHDAVFNSFFRESGGRNEAGSGLGLSTVKNIVESHGWTIRLQSEPGGYTEFVIHIPFL